MDKLIICKTDHGRYSVRPIEWAGAWDKYGRIQETGWNHLAIFSDKEDSEFFVKTKEAEEQGKMLILPCKPGDTVYVVEHRSGVCSYGQRWDLNCEYGCPYDNYSEKCDSKLEYYIKPQFINSLIDAVCIIGAIGKTVFLTEQEAKKAKEALEKKSIM